MDWKEIELELSSSFNGTEISALMYVLRKYDRQHREECHNMTWEDPCCPACGHDPALPVPDKPAPWVPKVGDRVECVLGEGTNNELRTGTIYCVFSFSSLGGIMVGPDKTGWQLSRFRPWKPEGR